MRVVVCAETFSSSLRAPEAAAAVVDGWCSVRPDDRVRAVPLSVGGSGLLAALEANAVGATRMPAEVADARGYATNAEWLQLADGTAVIESATACGADRLPTEQRNLRLATSYGVGQLVLAAADAGASAIVVGVGDSAAADGGAGLATAMGHRLLRTDGNRVKVGAEFLDQVARIVPRQPLPVPVTVLYDVDSPLLGPAGAIAAAATEPQIKTEDAALIEDNLRHLADIVERDLAGGPWRHLPGAGAGGGMAFGLAAFAGATLVPALRWFAQTIDLAALTAGADLVIAAAPHSASLTSPAGAANDAGARFVALVADTDAGGVDGELKALSIPTDADLGAGSLVSAAKQLASDLR